LLLAVQAEAAEITTIEGVSPPSGKRLAGQHASAPRIAMRFLHPAWLCASRTVRARSDARRSGDLRGDFRQFAAAGIGRSSQRLCITLDPIETKFNDPTLKNGSKVRRFGERQGWAEGKTSCRCGAERCRPDGLRERLQPDGCGAGAGLSPNPHKHDCEQLNYVLDGEVWVFVITTVPDEGRRFLRIPRNVLHWVWNRSDKPVTLVECHAPACDP
jgi:hypothetical protein